DWSSDVCSSDLCLWRPSPPQLPKYSIGAHKSAGSEIKALFLLEASGSGLGRHRHRSFLRLCLRLGFGDKLLPITTFFEASAYGADLAALLDDERRAALRARFGDGHVGGGEIAIRVAGATVEHAWASTAAFAGAAAA